MHPRGASFLSFFAAKALRPGARGFVTDVCVPLTALAPAVEAAQALCRQHGVLAPLLGHVGDANFHMLLMVDPGELQLGAFDPGVVFGRVSSAPAGVTLAHSDQGGAALMSASHTPPAAPADHPQEVAAAEACAEEMVSGGCPPAGGQPGFLACCCCLPAASLPAASLPASQPTTADT